MWSLRNIRVIRPFYLVGAQVKMCFLPVFSIRLQIAGTRLMNFQARRVLSAIISRVACWTGGRPEMFLYPGERQWIDASLAAIHDLSVARVTH